MIAGLNPITYGRQAQVKAKIWMSPTMMMVAPELCKDMVNNWEGVAEAFISKRETVHNQYMEEALKLQLLEVLKAADITNKDQVREKALELGLGFMVPALSENGVQFGNDDGDENDNEVFREIEEEMMETAQARDDDGQDSDGNNSNHNHNRSRNVRNNEDKHENDEDDL